MTSRKRNLIPGAIILAGGLFLLLFWPQLLSLLTLIIHPKRLTTISKTGYDLYDLLKAAGFQDSFRRFIVSQAAHESDNFTSLIFKNNLNPWGMKYRGQATAEGEKNGYAYYKDLAQAVSDYKRLFKSYGFVSVGTLDSFVKLLKNEAYFEAPYDEYLKGCTWFYNLYFPTDWKEPAVKGAGGSW